MIYNLADRKLEILGDNYFIADCVGDWFRRYASECQHLVWCSAPG